jgi:ribosomal protein S18 acetylase RimI-like enzyme
MPASRAIDDSGDDDAMRSNEATLEAEIVRLAAKDLPALRRVARGVFDHRIGGERARAFLADPSNVLIVARAKGVVVGQIQAILHRHPDAAADLFVENLGIAPGFRRRGLGRALIQAALAAGRELGARAAWVLTEAGNAAAHAVYAAAGAKSRQVAMFEFQRAGKRRR